MSKEIHGDHAADKVENANRRKELDDLITDTQESFCWLHVNMQEPPSEHVRTYLNRFYNSVLRLRTFGMSTHTHTHTRAACVFFCLSLYLSVSLSTHTALYVSLSIDINIIHTQ